MPVHVLIALGPNPTAIRLTFATNAADIWSALKSETAPPKLEVSFKVTHVL